ncbi:hypothetical protein OIE68_23080 [Nocardia vinacea]|uniref:hypothetical protein n=1 Tax=Nocardia vinacea TaxID=96468 RepID=UPI002E162F2C|nr:hypothetical protein OIE68_23080 [Nocardia vinacea]
MFVGDLFQALNDVDFVIPGAELYPLERRSDGRHRLSRSGHRSDRIASAINVMARNAAHIAGRLRALVDPPYKMINQLSECVFIIAGASGRVVYAGTIRSSRHHDGLTAIESGSTLEMQTDNPTLY